MGYFDPNYLFPYDGLYPDELKECARKMYEN